MCLMCEYYYDICADSECVASAKERAEADRRLHNKYRDSGPQQEYFATKNYAYFLHRGYSAPCEHMREHHAPLCNAVVKFFDKELDKFTYGDCNCWQSEEGWQYD